MSALQGTSDRRELLRDAGRAAAIGGLASLGGGALARAAGKEERPPNILILMTDQERHPDRLPDDLPLPTRCWLDANGTRLDRFHSSSMACSPSRACYWTGMYAPQQGVFGTFVVGTQFTMDPAIPTIGDLLSQQGYRTAFFGKWHLSYPGEPPTNPEAVVDLVGGNPLRGYGFDHSSISPPSDSGAYNDGYTNDPIWTAQALQFLRDHAGDEQPWLCVLSLLNPHDIQFYPRGFYADFERPDYGMPLEPSFESDSDLDDKPSAHGRYRQVVQLISGASQNSNDQPEYFRGLLNTYCDLIVRTDEMLGAVVKELIDQGALDDTAIVRMSDHGELGSAHRLQNKGTTIYDEQNRVPFTVVYPKRFPRGRRSQALGEAVDLLPTLLELSGERDPLSRWPWLRGESLVEALERPEGPGPRKSTLYRIDEYPITALGTEVPARAHIRSIYDGRYKFARYVAIEHGHFAGKEFVEEQEYELYDTWDDPYEIRNLANDRGYQKLVAEMLAWLTERELAKYSPVALPAFGPHGIIDALPETPSLSIKDRGLPSPWPDNAPGSYLKVPFEQPNPLRFFYEGSLPRSIGKDGLSGMATATDLARFYCGLH